MTIKISQLTTLGNVLANTIVPVVSNVGGTLTTLQSSVSQLQTYILSSTTTDIANLYANAGAVSGSLAVLTANAAWLAGDIVTLYANAGAQAGSIATLTSNAAVQAGDIATLYANAGIQSGSLGTINSSVTTLVANAASQAGDIATLYANTGAQAGSIATLTSNAAVQAGDIATLYANLGSVSGSLATINANLGATSSLLSTIVANAGAVSGSLATLTANAGVQAGILAGLTSYANANVASYLPTYSGNITLANVAYSGIIIAGPNFVNVSTTTTYSLSSTITDNILLITTTGLTATLNMPTTPVNGQIATISANAAVTLATGTGTVQPTFAGSYTVTSAPFKYVYRSASATWYRC